MHYEKNEYHEHFSICGLIIACVFLWWGFNILIDGAANWWWLFGFIWIFVGLSIISNQIYKLTNRSKLRNVVKQEFEQNPNISIEMIANNTGITIKDVRAIILDLKARKEFRGKFFPSYFGPKKGKLSIFSLASVRLVNCHKRLKSNESINAIQRNLCTFFFIFLFNPFFYYHLRDPKNRYGCYR